MSETNLCTGHKRIQCGKLSSEDQGKTMVSLRRRFFSNVPIIYYLTGVQSAAFALDLYLCSYQQRVRELFRGESLLNFLKIYLCLGLYVVDSLVVSVARRKVVNLTAIDAL